VNGVSPDSVGRPPDELPRQSLHVSKNDEGLQPKCTVTLWIAWWTVRDPQLWPTDSRPAGLELAAGRTVASPL